MNISGVLKAAIILVVVVLAECGCTSFGQDFQYQNIPLLKIGKTRDTDYRRILGKPKSVKTDITSKGRFKEIEYKFSKFYTVTVTLKIRVLDLEFRNGVLNAYAYLSTLGDDKTVIHAGNLHYIKRSTSGKRDVIRYEGKSSGVAKCPSMLGGFKSQCLKGTDEVWEWNKDKRSLYISFDKLGRVTQVNFTQINGNVYP